VKATAVDEAKTAREATRAPTAEASKEKETTLAAEKEVEPLKEATRVLVTEASKEGDATPVPMAEAMVKGKEKSPSPGQANLEV
jgi:peptide subunit release factor RF-3